MADSETVEQRLAFIYQWLTKRDEPLAIDVDDFMNEVHSIVHQARREALGASNTSDLSVRETQSSGSGDATEPVSADRHASMVGLDRDPIAKAVREARAQAFRQVAELVECGTPERNFAGQGDEEMVAHIRGLASDAEAELGDGATVVAACSRGMGFVELTEVITDHLTCQARPVDGRSARPATQTPVPYAMTCGADIPGDCGPRGTFQAAHVADCILAGRSVLTH